MSTQPPDKLEACRSESLRGDVTVPGDKSISHRALILGALAGGVTEITGLLESEDVLATARALRVLGIPIERDGAGVWTVKGRGLGGLQNPASVLDLGNSGTGARLLMGILATHDVRAVLTGDGSLRRRPMNRVAAPLREFGAEIDLTDGDRLPAVIKGLQDAIPIDYRVPVPSAQVKSAVMLAALNVAGRSRVAESAPTRDHTENLLRLFGAGVTAETGPDGEIMIEIAGQPELSGRALTVPGDPSSAAFPVVAALLVPGSEIAVRQVGLNPRRTGLYETLGEMGADLRFTNQSEMAGERLGDIAVRHGPLKGVEVPADRVPSMVDEIPVLCMAAACAEGTTRLTGLSELRVKESDRIAAVAAGLRACGVAVEEKADGLVIEGKGTPPPGGASVATAQDHRIAMSFAVLGLASEDPVVVDGAAYIGTSFPGFAELMTGLGARIDSPGKGPA